MAPIDQIDQSILQLTWWMIVFPVFMSCSFLAFILWLCACCRGEEKTRHHHHKRNDFQTEPDDDRRDQNRDQQDDEREKSIKTSPRNKPSSKRKIRDRPRAKLQSNVVMMSYRERMNEAAKADAKFETMPKDVGKVVDAKAKSPPSGDPDIMKLPTVFRTSGLSPPRTIQLPSLNDPTKTKIGLAKPSDKVKAQTKTVGSPKEQIEVQDLTKASAACKRQIIDQTQGIQKRSLPNRCIIRKITKKGGG